MPAAVVLAVGAGGLLRECDQQQAFVVRGVVPDPGEVVVLGAEHLCQRPLDVCQVGEVPFRNLPPDEVGELLGAVGMPAGGAEKPLEGLLPDPSVRGVEPALDVGAELVRRDHPDLDPLRASPERLVLVVEDRLQDVALAAQVDVGDLGLRLEDRTHQVRKLRVELQHFLELIEDQRRPLLALGADLAGELEELLDRVVDLRRRGRGRPRS